MTSTILFDLDGLLADTESLHCRAYQQTLLRHGFELTDDHYRDAWIRRGLGVDVYVQGLGERGAGLDPEALKREKAVEYARLVETCCRPMPGAMELLARLKGHKTLAVASSAYADAVSAVLSKLCATGYFSRIVTGSDVKRLKPHPDLFLLAAERLGVPSAECVVIEDAQKGVAAAKAAGMKCIAVPSAHTADNDFSAADVVVPSLHAVTLELIDGL